MLDATGLGPEDEVHILVNGSTDQMLPIMRSVAASDSWLRVHSLAMGDKCNAWNAYVHGYADPRQDVHVFLDGDAIVVPGSLTALARALDAAPDALAASATPREGRTAAAWKARILSEHGLAGNLYALPGAALRRLRAEGLPCRSAPSATTRS